MADLVPIEEIRAAALAMADHVERTPTVASAGMTALLGVPTTLKRELLQRSGPFKPRGLATKLLALNAAERDAGVVAVSGGNHGIAVAEVAGGWTFERRCDGTLPAAALHRAYPRGWVPICG